MNKWKKAISVGMSATLLASLFTVIAASSALAAVTVTSAGNVPIGGTSANPTTWVFTESSVTGIPTNGPGSFTVTIAPAAPGLGAVTFSGTPVVSAPGSLGATATATGSVLTVSWTNSDLANIESITVTGLKIAAAAGTSTGAITATMGGATGNGSIAGFQSGGTASGTIATGIGVGALSATVNVTTAGCTFASTAVDIDPGPGITTSGSWVFAVGAAGTSAETRTGTRAAGGPGQDVLTFTVGSPATSVHNAGDVVTQTNACLPNGVLGSPGTVVAALTFDTPLNPVVFPGENNSPAGDLVLHEPSAGFLPAASTFTYTIATAGVQFSTAPTLGGQSTITANTAASPSVVTTAAAHGLVTGNSVTITGSNSTPIINGTFVVTVLSATTFSIPVTVTTAGTTGTVSGPSQLGLSAPVLSADRKSVTVTVSTVSVIPATIVLRGILYDVAATVPAGTFVSVGVATSGLLAVLPTSRTNAVVFRGITASATSPTVYIGENSQKTGIITMLEASAGFFTDGTGSNNIFQICPTGAAYTFTLAPYAKVVGGVAAGNLILRDGAAASATNIVQGTAVGTCFQWTVWTKSTTASSIQIGSSDFTSGPLINVGVGQAPGGVQVNINIGSAALGGLTLAATVQFATAVYRVSVTVTALAQTAIAAGASDVLVGSIQIAETGLGQLKAGEQICVEVLPRAGTSGGTGPGSGIQDVFLSALATADLPIATASGSGLVISPVIAGGCLPSGGAPSTSATSFSFFVNQQTTAGDGMLVISNIHYTTTADATTGPVQVRVSGLGGAPTGVQFQSTISNARIGSQLAGTAGTRLGVTQTGAFSTSTKVAKTGKYVTYRFDFGVAAAGKTLEIWGATKTGNDWSAFAKVTSRVANASGVVYYYIRQNSATWKSYRAYWAAGGIWTPARQARWIP